MTSMLNTNMGNENVFKPLVKFFDAPCKTKLRLYKIASVKIKRIRPL